MVADRQPLRVLVEHRVDDVHERFISREESVASGQQIAFQHPFQRMLAEHFDHPAIDGEFAAIAVLGQI